MSPSFVNDHSHAVRVRDNDNALRRIIRGQVVEASGRFADNLKAAGLSEASAEDRERWDAERQRRSGALSGDAVRLAAKEALAQPRAALRALTTVAPLQVVIGDDQAPYGPPTGTITTKQALARQSPELRRAFADGEALPGEIVGDGSRPHPRLAEVPTGDQVHNAQADASALAEAAADSHLEGHASLDTDVGGQLDAGGGDERISGDYDAHNTAELRAEANARGLSVSRADGKEGDPLKADLVSALQVDDEQSGDGS